VHQISGLLKDRSMKIRPPELAGNPTLDLVDQHLAIDDAKAIFFREIFCADDRRHAKRRKLER